jgi:enoyl-CoA hydratase/carnithine racemase
MGTVPVHVPELINGESLRAFAHALECACLDQTERVILLEGSAGTFCRGMDLSMLYALQAETSGRVDLAAELEAFAACLRHIRHANKPVIGVVDGAVLAGGVGIMAACDLVIATAGSTFGLSELLFGLVPAIIWPLLLERMPAQKARRWALAACTYSASEARDAGLVDVVVAPSDLAHTVRTWVRQFSRVDQAATGQLKRLSAERPSLGLEAALRHGVLVTAEILQNESVLRGLRRFFDDGAVPWEVI